LAVAGHTGSPGGAARPCSCLHAPRPAPARWRRLSPAVLAVAALGIAGITAGTGFAAASTTTTSTTTAPPATTAPSAADRWLIGAIGTQREVGSVHIAGKITQGKNVTTLSLQVNGDGEGGGVFVEKGNQIRVERVGSLLYFNAPKKFWARSATAAQTAAYGGKWLAFSALDSRVASFDQFLNSADVVTAAFEGHIRPLTVSRPTTFAGHKVVIVKDTVTAKGKKSTGLMYVAAQGPAYVYKIVDDTPGEVGTLVFSHYGKAVALTVPSGAIKLS
jgi:hypothetical protein